MSLTCFIVDDHRANGEKIAEYAKRAGLTVLDVETDSTVAFEKIKAMAVKPDVVFMDISMPGMNGLEMAEKLEDIAPIIFTTAHRHYAAESYKLDAVYYLVKPITYNDFKKSVDKLRENIAAKESQAKPRKEYIKIPGHGKSGFIRLKTDEVIYLESAQHYVEVHTTSKNYITHRSMNALLDELGGLPFVRVHKSFAVNVEKVVELKDNTIHLSDGSKVDLGSTFKDDFLSLL
ncbi:response regulator transcription factor [Pedobacter sp. ISL-68]|uniref:LytR/AlgR family response regulator transcription factor n=1 Tax=unclassified Pedobacter TaxID=2628915 RepID=UPI001BECDDF1|nr:MULTISPECIES: LytTR family DNA-binding domain-containing protein [unclassified Pedobacter]MBT2561311.1 response regulator transcription factor [Pedobacter sp. ISL-64]MBT2590700.1 response regulator transcription factor [Pedobacter sp. ISL-68]